MIPDKFLIAAVGVFFFVASVIPTHLRATNTARDTIFIKSIVELAEYAGRDDVLIKMKAGTYTLDNEETSKNMVLKKYSGGKPSSDYNVSALLHFSGNNSSYNLEGVEINISSALHKAFGRNHLYEIFVTGNNNHIHGLKVRDVGDEHPHFGAIMLHVMGDNNVISEADIFWDDVHRFRNPDAPHGSFAGAENIKLFNYTGMPVKLNDLAINCSISNAVSTNQTKVINAGVGGNTTRDLLKRIDGDVLVHKPDLVLLMVGTNDMLNSRKMIGYEEYASNLDLLIQKIKTSGSELVLMSPIPADSAYLFTRHDKRLFKESPNQKIDSIGEIVEKLALDNQAYFFDLNAEFRQLNLPLHNQDMFIRNVKNSGKADGVHPTALGYRFMAENVYHFLKENKLIGEGKKIICFGDSITRGGGNGANYPAYLGELISELSQSN